MGTRINSPDLLHGRLAPSSIPSEHAPSAQEIDGDREIARDIHPSTPSSTSTSPPPSPGVPAPGTSDRPTQPPGQKSRLFAMPGEDILGGWKPTLVLENAGSVARDHLASERTFLAYVRTSLTIASTGVALVQLFTISAATNNKALERYSRPIGAIIIFIGLATLVLGIVRYFTIQTALMGGNFPVARVSTIMLGVIMSAVIVAVLASLSAYDDVPKENGV